MYRSPTATHKWYRSPMATGILYRSPTSTDKMYGSPKATDQIYRSPTDTDKMYKSPTATGKHYRSPTATYKNCLAKLLIIFYCQLLASMNESLHKFNNAFHICHWSCFVDHIMLAQNMSCYWFIVILRQCQNCVRC